MAEQHGDVGAPVAVTGAEIAFFRLMKQVRVKYHGPVGAVRDGDAAAALSLEKLVDGILLIVVAPEILRERCFRPEHFEAAGIWVAIGVVR